jgi:hypothetical protein
MEDLERYLDEVVGPTIADFEANPMSRRHAFLACVATFHGVDYLAYPRKPQQLRQRFNKQSPEFALVDRVAHAFKHVVSSHVASPQRQPLKAAEVIARPPGFCDVAFSDISRVDDPIGSVTLDQERDVDLLAVLKQAVAFLRAQLRA